MAHTPEKNDPFASFEPQKLKDAGTLQLNAEDLKAWVNHQAKSSNQGKKNAPHEASELGRFGLKSAQDVIQFLNSPAGQTTKTKIAAQLALIAKIQRERQINIQEQLLFRRRLLAYLFLSLIAYREARAHAVHDQIQAQIDKILHHSTKIDISSSTDAYHQVSEDIINAYDAEISLLNHELEINAEEDKNLTREENQHQVELEQFKLKEDEFQTAMTDLDKTFSEVDHKTQDNLPLDQLKKEYHRLTVDIDKLSQSIASDLPKKDDQSKAEVYKLYALQFKADFIKDLIDVSENKKQFLDADGQEVNSLSKAHLVLRKDDKIVKHDGEYYLLKADQDINKMKPSEKDFAKQQFKQSKNDFRPIKKMVLDNLKTEKEHHINQAEALKDRRDHIRTHKLETENQLTQIQAARATVLTALDNPAGNPSAITGEATASTPPLTPSLTPRPSPKPNPATTQSFRKIIEFLKKNEPNLNRTSLQELTQTSPKAQNYINQELTKIPTSAPIPHTMMIALLRNLERFGIDATKSTTAIKNPLELQDELRPTPTPFSTKPR